MSEISYNFSSEYLTETYPLVYAVLKAETPSELNQEVDDQIKLFIENEDIKPIKSGDSEYHWYQIHIDGKSCETKLLIRKEYFLMKALTKIMNLDNGDGKVTFNSMRSIARFAVDYYNQSFH